MELDLAKSQGKPARTTNASDSSALAPQTAAARRPSAPITFALQHAHRTRTAMGLPTVLTVTRMGHVSAAYRAFSVWVTHPSATWTASRAGGATSTTSAASGC